MPLYRRDMNNRETSEHDLPPESRFLARRDELSAYIRAHVRNWADAEDIFQQTAVVALRKLSEGVRVEKMGAWSREIARRTILDYWKRNQRRSPVLSADAMDSLESAFSGYDASDVRQDTRLETLLGCLSKMPSKLRSIVDKFYKEHLSLAEIGRESGRSAGAVQVSLSRIRRSLLDCVKQGEREGASRP